MQFITRTQPVVLDPAYDPTPTAASRPCRAGPSTIATWKIRTAGISTAGSSTGTTLTTGALTAWASRGCGRVVTPTHCGSGGAIQLHFVDAPRVAADRADDLVGEAVQTLTAAMSRQRSALAEWRDSQHTDTELLPRRCALSHIPEPGAGPVTNTTESWHRTSVDLRCHDLAAPAAYSNNECHCESSVPAAGVGAE